MWLWNVYSCFQRYKNYKNRPQNARVVVENNVASFFSGHGVDYIHKCLNWKTTEIIRKQWWLTMLNNVDDKHYVVVDEVKIMAWSDGHCAATTASDTSVCLMQGLMDKDKCWDDSIAMTQWQRNVVTYRHDVWRYVLNAPAHKHHITY